MEEEVEDETGDRGEHLILNLLHVAYMQLIHVCHYVQTNCICNGSYVMAHVTITSQQYSKKNLCIAVILSCLSLY